MKQRNGFTLIEMLIALTLFAMLAGAAVMLLRFSVDAELASRNRLDVLAGMRRFHAVWQADMAQAVKRTTRDATGAFRPAFETGISDEPGVLLRMVRSGWTNHEGAPRASIQKVAYRLAGGRLERAGYAMVDGAQAETPAVLLDDVRAISLRYRDDAGLWLDSWQPQTLNKLPIAIEMTIQFERGEPLRIVSLLGVNYQ